METKNTTRPMWSEREIAFTIGVIEVISKKEFGREFTREESYLAYIVAETLAVVDNKMLIEGMFDYAKMLRQSKDMLALHIKMASEINDDNLDDIALQIKTALLGCEVALRLKYR